MKYWDDETNTYTDYDVCWSGALHRQDPDSHSLLGDGWGQREQPFMAQRKADPELSARAKEVAQTRQPVVRDEGPPTLTCVLCGKLLAPSSIRKHLTRCPWKPGCIRRQRVVDRIKVVAA